MSRRWAGGKQHAALLDARASLRTQHAQLSPETMQAPPRAPKEAAWPRERRSAPAPKPIGTGWPPGVWPATPRLPDDCAPFARHILEEPPMRAVRIRECLGMRLHLWNRWSSRATRHGIYGEVSAFDRLIIRDARRRMAIEDRWPGLGSLPVHYVATGFGLDTPYARGLFLEPYREETRRRVSAWARTLAPKTAAAWDAEVHSGLP